MVAVGCTMPPPPDPDAEPELCQPGTFSATGEEPCAPAPVGTYVDTTGAAVDPSTGLTPGGTWHGRRRRADEIVVSKCSGARRRARPAAPLLGGK